MQQSNVAKRKATKAELQGSLCDVAAERDVAIKHNELKERKVDRWQNYLSDAKESVHQACKHAREMKTSMKRLEDWKWEMEIELEKWVVWKKWY